MSARRGRLLAITAVAAIGLTACFGPGSYPTSGAGAIPPGLYHLFDAADHCRWTTRDANGNLTAWSNGGGETGFPSYAQVQSTGDTLAIDGCWFRLADSVWDKKFPPDANGDIGQGMFRVGVEVPPGTYQADGPGVCSWARVSSFTRQNGWLKDIVQEGVSDGGPATVTIAPTDFGFVSWVGCAKWKKIG